MNTNETSGPEVILVARSQSVADLVEQCARGELPFSGPDSLHSKVAAMGFSTTSLYPAVLAAKEALPSCPYCGATEGLRVKCDGGGIQAPEYTCEGCFTPTDDGPCFDDLPAIQGSEK